MNAEHLLDAIGQLDDDLIQAAECCTRVKPKRSAWAGWAASIAVVLVLGWALTRLGMSGENLASGGGTGAPSAESGGPGGGVQTEDSGQSVEDDCFTNDSEDLELEEIPLMDVLMVDGELYYSTGQAVEVEASMGEMNEVTSYTSGAPAEDGQSNFSHDLSAKYIKIPEGLAVLVEDEWILFVPDEPAP